MATKKTTSKKTSTKKPAHKAKASKVRSFHVAPPDRPFWTFIFTVQSVYWVLIGAAVLAVGIYVASLQIRVNHLYDQVDVNSSQSQMNYDVIKKINSSMDKSEN